MARELVVLPWEYKSIDLPEELFGSTPGLAAIKVAKGILKHRCNTK